MSKDKSNVPNNPYKRDNRDNLYNQRKKITAKKKTPDFSEVFQVPTEVK